MSYLDLSRMIEKLREQKIKYWAKVLSDSAIATNWRIALGISDIYPYYVWLLLPQYSYAVIALAFLLGLDPRDLEPLNIDFEILLPEIEELMQGILFKSIKLYVEELYKWMKSYEELVKENIKEEYQKYFLEKKTRKGVYDQSQYNYAYYDPPLVLEFIRSTLPRFLLQWKTFSLIKHEFEESAKKFGVGEIIAREVFDRLSHTIATQPSCMVLGYGVLGYSPLCEKVKIYAKTRFIEYEGVEVEAGITQLAHPQYGFLLGVSHLSIGRLVPKRDIYKNPPTQVTLTMVVKGSPAMVRYVAERCRKTIRGLTYIPLAVANYQRAEERMDWRKSERADQYFALQQFRVLVEHIVDPIIRKYEANPVKIRMYKSAVLQLISIKAKRHKWGYKAFEAMTEDQLKTWWLDHWKAQGLKTEVLEELYRVLSKWLPRLREIKYNLGAYLSKTRKRLAQLLR